MPSVVWASDFSCRRRPLGQSNMGGTAASEKIFNLIRREFTGGASEIAEMTGTLELLQKVLNEMDAGIVVIDPDDRIVFFNREAGRMTNEDPEKRIGQPIFLCHPKTSEEKVRQFIDEFRRDPKHEFKPQIINYQGRYLEEDFFSLFDDQGEYLGLVELLYDAKEKASLLKQLGKFEEPHVSGVGPKAPQKPSAKL